MTEHGYVFDTSWARHGWPAVKAAGFTCVSLYLSHDPSKDAKAADVAGVQAVGLDLMLNFESTTGRPKEGPAAGAADARSANAEADKLGYPDHCAIYFSCDTNAIPVEVEGYYRAARLASKRPIGAYGGAVMVLNLLWSHAVDYAWVANAGSWDHGVADVGAHLHQHYHTHNVLQTPIGWGLNDYDESVVLNPNFGQWGDSTPAPTTKDTMSDFLIRVNEDGGEYAVSYVSGKRHLATPDQVGVFQVSLASRGLPTAPINVSRVQADAIPDYVAGGTVHVPTVDTQAVAEAVVDLLEKRLKD